MGLSIKRSHKNVSFLRQTSNLRCFSYAEWQQSEVQTSAYRENLSLLVLAQDQQPLVEHLQCAEQWQSGLPIMIVDYDSKDLIEFEIPPSDITKLQMPPK